MILTHILTHTIELASTENHRMVLDCPSFCNDLDRVELEYANEHWLLKTVL